MGTSAPTSVKVKASAYSPVEAKGKGEFKEGQQPSPKAGKVWPWKTLLGLTLILTELWLNTGIIWGVFMLLWAIMGISSGQTYILEILQRREHLILYWITIHLWLLFAVFFFMSNQQIYSFCLALLAKLSAVFS
ncbi:hypothetical protein ACMXYV_11510 [Neptuniibacter sp. SY11_33]|uniref:hypothetical protein n=1 Tax=Neptuniibacter sp. SY11_33 TaxID=3398215 RepID=UPI0039F53A1A